MINLKYDFKPSEENEKAILLKSNPAPLDSVEKTSIIFESGYQFGNLKAIIAGIQNTQQEYELISTLYLKNIFSPFTSEKEFWESLISHKTNIEINSEIKNSYRSIKWKIDNHKKLITFFNGLLNKYERYSFSDDFYKTNTAYSYTLKYETHKAQLSDGKLEISITKHYSLTQKKMSQTEYSNLKQLPVIKKIRENENELISTLEKIRRNFNLEEHQAILELINKNISLIVNFPKTDTVKTREIIDEIECLKIESGLEYDRLWDSTMFNIRAENLKKIRPELAKMFRLIRSM